MRPALAILSLLLLACGKRQAPPGASVEPSARSKADALGAESAAVPASAAATSTSAASAPSAPKPGSPDDNLPFAADGTRVGSVAWRTWVYTDVGKQRTRYGYLRAGSVVDARGPAIQNEGCVGGWYRVNPRGFVCLGLGATLKLDDPVVIASVNRPVRGQGLPYLYALSKQTPPLLYFRLPSKAQMKEAEGMDVTERGVHFRELVQTQGLDKLVALQDAPPDFLNDGKKLDKPYGVKQPLQKGVEAGPSSADSGFAISKTFLWEGRAFGLTTELDLVALDRVNIVKPSAFHGVELGEDEGLPVAFVKDHYADHYTLDAHGQPQPKGSFGYREGMKLSGQKKPGGFLELRDGSWAAQISLRVLKVRDSFPSFATGDRKWVDISIREQSLVAYVGRRAVYATLVSTGRGGLGPHGDAPDSEFERLQATVRGTFMIYQKDVSSTMDGDEDQSDSFNLRDVPFVQYFHKGFALHGTYWHDEFGKVRSHGCVNLAPLDAAWLFEWTDPSVPPDWHGVVNKERGTVVYIHV
ncbi:MAG TPA: L,D-transpeptidase [Polyangiaceae bacterium]|jgi:hypothetical protein